MHCGFFFPPLALMSLGSPLVGNLLTCSLFTPQLSLCGPLFVAVITAINKLTVMWFGSKSVRAALRSNGAKNVRNIQPGVCV